MKTIEISNVSVILILLYYSIGWTNEVPVKTSSRRPLIMVSFDGMRADKFDEFVRENPSCNFNRIIKNGLKADYMIPSFPSKTFPNHYTIATGVYPETHGMIHFLYYLLFRIKYTNKNF